VPFFPQTEYQCGPAALATVLANAGVKVTPEDLVSQVYIPERKGSLQIEMIAAARRHGMVSYVLMPRFEDMLRELAAGNPVIVLQNIGFGEGWHYAVAIGYDHEKSQLILRSGTDERKTLYYGVHEFVWMRSGYWAMVAVPPDRIPATAEEERFLSSVAAMERAGNPRVSQAAYATFLKRWPGNSNAAIGLANAHYALKELKEAEAVLRQASQRDPDSVILLNNLAHTIAEQGRPEEALPIIDRAAAKGGQFADAVQKTRTAILEKISAKKK
jgi:tetratricopeptide (TPR) repeat protein